MEMLGLALVIAAVAWMICLPWQIGEVIDGLRDLFGRAHKRN